MCLGIPGRITSIDQDNPHLAMVEVTGVGRRINIALLEDEGVGPGDWVLIHVGFAMSRIDEEAAALALEGLRMMSGTFDDELVRFLESSQE